MSTDSLYTTEDTLGRVHSFNFWSEWLSDKLVQLSIFQPGEVQPYRQKKKIGELKIFVSKRFRFLQARRDKYSDFSPAALDERVAKVWKAFGVFPEACLSK